MPVYFIHSNQITDQSVQLEADLKHHLRDVLRLKVGETLSLVDEQPRRHLARVTECKPDFRLRLEGEPLLDVEDRPNLHLAVALLKRDKMDWLVQKTTELGISQLTPLLCARSLVRPDQKRISHQVARWEKVAREAAQQSCRWTIPQINAPQRFDQFISKTTNSGLHFLFSERKNASPLKSILKDLESCLEPTRCLVGPEGGWTDEEIYNAESVGYHALSLGDGILRTETAAMAAVAILQHELSSQSRDQ